jgi:hypothetical protein
MKAKGIQESLIFRAAPGAAVSSTTYIKLQVFFF